MPQEDESSDNSREDHRLTTRQSRLAAQESEEETETEEEEESDFDDDVGGVSTMRHSLVGR